MGEMGDDQHGSGPGGLIPHVLSGLRLDELPRGAQERPAEIVDLDLDTTLHRTVQAAVDLVDARY